VPLNLYQATVVWDEGGNRVDREALVVSIVSLVVGKGFLLGGLWLRLRWRTRHEEVQRQHLTSVTQSIADAGDLEFVEQRPDGHSVRIKITRGPGEKSAA
jgi:hypothetical protein